MTVIRTVCIHDAPTIAWFLEELREQGLHLVIAGIAMPNQASQALHERFGFRKVGEFTQEFVGLVRVYPEKSHFMRFFTLQTPKATRLIGIFRSLKDLRDLKIYKSDRLLGGIQIRLMA